MSGFVICCVLYSQQDSDEKFKQNMQPRPLDNDDFISSCSSATLNVTPSLDFKSEREMSVFKIVIAGCLGVILCLGCAILIAYRRYNVYMKTVKAKKTMKDVS